MATGYTAGNLFAGAATSFLVDGVTCGGTKDGVKVRRETTWLDLQVDQFAGIVKKSPTMVRMYLETILAEATLANIQLAWNIASAALVSNSLQLYQPQSGAAAEHTVYIDGPTVTGKTTRNYDFARVVIMADGEQSISRTAPTEIPFNAEILAENTTPDRWGSVYDV